MRKIDYGQNISASAVVLGCMRIDQMEKSEIEYLIHCALDSGINTFDHADIYGGGRSEELFGQVLTESPGIREEMFLQSKCGIGKGMYDFSKEHILESVEGILKRLNTDYLDLLILHRPDILIDTDEVAEAFDRLASQGKVKSFGISNMNSMQIELLQRSLKEKLLVNQLQLSLAHTLILDEGINVNMPDSLGMMRSGSVLDYCRLNKIGIQSWSSLQYGFFEGTFIGSERYPELNGVLNILAEKYGVTPGTIAIAWILRIPGVEQAIVGTTKARRIEELSLAADIELTREEWYKLYLSAGNRLP